MFKYSGFRGYSDYVAKSNNVSAYEAKKEKCRRARLDFAAFEEVAGVLLSAHGSMGVDLVLGADRPNMP